MRHLLQPQVLKTAGIAAAVSTLACYPQLTLWLHKPGPIWYLLATIFTCSIMLWGFVFAWHEPYTNRPVFIFKLDVLPFVIATVLGLGTATLFHLWFDPSLRAKFPDEYPPDLQHWLASLLFSLALTQLLLVFAPFDWLMRLAKNRWVAMTLTAFFAASVQGMKIHSLHTPVSPALAIGLLATRFVGGFLAAAFYLRGGVILVWWWALLVVCRHLLDFAR